MAKELPYFKFHVAEWILGRISDHSDKVQGAFIRAICFYWNHDCNYNVTDFKKKLGAKRFNLLLELNFFDIENENVYIRFLDEQFKELSDIHKVRVKGGLARAKQVHKQKPSYIDKIIEDKIIEDKEEDSPTDLNNSVVKYTNLSHLDFFLQSTQEKESALKSARVGFGLKYWNIEKIIEEAKKHDAIHLQKFPNSDFNKWRQYLSYHFETISKLPNAKNPQTPKKNNLPLSRT